MRFTDGTTMDVVSGAVMFPHERQPEQEPQRTQTQNPIISQTPEFIRGSSTEVFTREAHNGEDELTCRPSSCGSSSGDFVSDSDSIPQGQSPSDSEAIVSQPLLRTDGCVGRGERHRRNASPYETSDTEATVSDYHCDNESAPPTPVHALRVKYNAARLLGQRSTRGRGRGHRGGEEEELPRFGAML